ncbi:hypothetical protein BDV95DRAFT_56740 [Massariosphaeria phaeospora]|uniref:Rhodopsin domain-containing protein n=1 Tax=Massariosphaeria phaeospora TaxID=100035 RepID=A0A7C8M9B0_9PLEO|nr:hypothetical protein BDV95DRAFT_56740 [Massariosphaeria phaeospora]
MPSDIEPAMQPPPGVESNFVDPPSILTSSYAVVPLCIVIATIFVGIRIYTKAIILRKVVTEDYFLIVAWLAYLGYLPVGLIINKTKPGPGVHMWNVPATQIPKYSYNFHVATILYDVVVIPLKVSILLQFMRIFSPGSTRNYIFWISIALIVCNVGYYGGYMLYQIIHCRLSNAYCHDTFFVSACINVVSDVGILILPHRAIWGLNMPRGKKIALSGVFLIGLFACIAAAIRLSYAVTLRHSDDFTYWMAKMSLWVFPEFTSGFLVACLPVLPRFANTISEIPLITRLVSSIRSLSGSRNVPTNASPHGTARTGRSNRSKGGMGNRNVTDIEFQELVVETDSRSVVDYDGGRGSQDKDKKLGISVTRASSNSR